MHHGIMLLYEGLSPGPTTVPALEVLGKSIVLRGYCLTETTSDLARLGRGERFINGVLTDGSLKPITAKTFLLDQIVEAHGYLESNQQFGKVVVVI